MKTGRFGEQRIRPVSENDEVREQFAIGIAGRDTGNLAVFPDEIDDGELWIDFGARRLGCRRVPLIEFGAKHAIGVVRWFGEFHRAENTSEHRIFGQSKIALLDDGTLERGFRLRIPAQIARWVPVENATGDVFRARVLTPLENNDGESCRGHLPGGGDARRVRPRRLSRRIDRHPMVRLLPGGRMRSSDFDDSCYLQLSSQMPGRLRRDHQQCQRRRA